MSEPFLVRPGWDTSYVVAGLGVTYRLLHWPDGGIGFEHRCDRGERGVVICAPKLQQGHTVSSLSPPTITPSILCPDCGTHGFITDGRWIDAGSPAPLPAHKEGEE